MSNKYFCSLLNTCSTCKTKKTGKQEPESGKGNKHQQKASSKQQLHNVCDGEDNDEHAFSVSEGYVCGVKSGNESSVKCRRGNFKACFDWLRALCNVVDKETWQDLKVPQTRKQCCGNIVTEAK